MQTQINIWLERPRIEVDVLTPETITLKIGAPESVINEVCFFIDRPGIGAWLDVLGKAQTALDELPANGPLTIAPMLSTPAATDDEVPW